jgi:prepilin-type N-terminal cleavage/methylation domain-containing protein
MKTKPCANGCAPCNQAGFSMVEMMIAIIIFTIVMGAVYGLLEIGRRGRGNTMQRNEVIQNVRIALNTLGRDALNAGVGYPNAGAALLDNTLSNPAIGILPTADPDNDSDLLTPVFAGNNMNVISGTPTDQITFVFQDDSFNSGRSLPINRAVNSGEQLRIATPCDNTPCNAPAEIGDLYVVTGINGSAIGMVTETPELDKINFADRDPLELNKPGATSPIKQAVWTPGCGNDCDAGASVMKIMWVTYRVVDDGNGVGTLVRRVYGGLAGFTDQPLAFGVENLQIAYTLDDGALVEAPDSLQMQRIRQVRVTVNVRSPDLDPRTNQPYRSVLTSSYSTRNLGYEER